MSVQSGAPESSVGNYRGDTGNPIFPHGEGPFFAVALPRPLPLSGWNETPIAVLGVIGVSAP